MFFVFHFICEGIFKTMSIMKLADECINGCSDILRATQCVCVFNTEKNLGRGCLWLLLILRHRMCCYKFLRFSFYDFCLDWGHENPGYLADLCVSFLVWQSSRFVCVCGGDGS